MRTAGPPELTCPLGGTAHSDARGETAIPTVLLMGPTASGKSAIALMIASRLPVEIVSVDSAQVYRGMDIGTAKPDALIRAQVPHHLIDIVDPDAAYSAARFRADALAHIEAVKARSRIPLLVGGTMLYFKALREGLSDLPGADASVRAALDARAAREGWPALHAELARLDPATAARVAPHDAQRIQRALEVHALSGEPLSALRGTRSGEPGHAFLAFALYPGDRAELHRRIALRFDAMLAAGLIDELRTLRERHALQPNMASMRCVGYRQALQFLAGDADMKTMRERGIAATRQLAKRQLTWLRATEANRYDTSTLESEAIANTLVVSIRAAMNESVR